MNQYYILTYALDDTMPIIGWGDEESSGFYKNKPVEERTYQLIVGGPKPASIGEFDQYWVARPIVSSRVKAALEELIPEGSVQFVKAEIKELNLKEDYYLAHFIKRENCVDMEKSNVVFDEDGDMESVSNIILQEDFYNKDLNERLAFKLKTDYVHHVVDESIKEKIESMGATGFRFIALEDWSVSSPFGG